MDDRQSKRDLVLAPSEYAYMQDVTKGVIKTYTGPTVINPTAQERPVRFDADAKAFEPCALEEAVQPIAIAPEGYYVVLKNPSTRGDHPAAGAVHPSPDLDIGRKINITGPCAFALWPGQMVKLVQGHHLRSNQYLLVRVYNEDEARQSWGQAVIKPAGLEGGAAPARAPADLAVGRLYVIKGTDVSFYIPPTGVGVVPDEVGSYVRDALTLERLEYAILVDQNGKKRYERGPQVVFPEPTESFITAGTSRKFRAIELSEVEGLHVKVIAAYDDHREGDELFITGAETAIYYPREEHSLIPASPTAIKHHAIAVPAGEGRYVINRKTGEVRMVRGPAMVLPVPIDEAVVRRALTDRECATWYPGNAEALAYNRGLRALEDPTRPGVIAGAAAAGAQARFAGVPSTNIWVGYAVMVVDKQGKRRVEQGPRNLLLGYDESLEVIQLSTGKPKSTDTLIETVFLRVLNNKIGDICVVETLDHVAVTLEYSMRVNFTGDPMRWFEVENYVKFLCDHVRSVLKGVVKKASIETFYATSVDVLRDAILGRPDDKGVRPGMRFPENGMHVTDVEVLDVTIGDDDIAALLGEAQHEAVQANIAVLRARRGLELTSQQEAITRGEAEARAETARQKADLDVAATADRLRVALAAIASDLEQAERSKQASIARNAAHDVDHQADLARRRADAELEQAIARDRQALVIEALRAEVSAAVERFGAAQGGFSEALLALSSNEVLAKVAEAMSVQSFVGGKTLTDVIDKVFAGTPLAGVLDKVKQRSNNGKALPASKGA
jgi:major vault protein